MKKEKRKIHAEMIEYIYYCLTTTGITSSQRIHTFLRMMMVSQKKKKKKNIAQCLWLECIIIYYIY